MKRSEVKEEIVKCGTDPVYFISKYIKIRHPKRGLIPFKTFEYQNHAIECFRRKRFNVILKPRQMGYTELVSAFVVWLMLFHPHQSILALATKSETAKQVVKRVRTGIRYLPSWLLISDITVDNRTSIELANGSSVKSIAKSEDAGRSEALSLLIVDEAAHIQGFDEVWTGIKPTISAGGRIIMLSTPLGVGNVFHKTYMDAVNKENDFNPIRVNWWEHPEHISDLKIDERTGKYTSTWFRTETKGFSERQIAQEYECEFNSSGDTFFSADVITKIDASFPKVDSTVLESLMAEGVQRYVPPAAGKRYIAGVDSASGHAFDRCAVEVFDIDTMEQVAELNTRLKPRQFAEQMCELGYEYNTALLVCENNSVGLAVIEHLKIAKYPNFFYSLRGAKAGEKLGEAGNAAEGSMSDTFTHGISTQGTNRPFLLNKLEELIREGRVRINSRRFHSEMKTFTWHGSRPEARSGYRDDLILAAGFAIWIRENLFGAAYNDDELSGVLLRSITYGATTNNQINGASKNPDYVPSKALGVFGTGQNPYSFSLPNGKKIDLLAEMGMAPVRRR